MNSVKFEEKIILRKKEENTISGLGGLLIKNNIAKNLKEANLILFASVILMFFIAVLPWLMNKKQVSNEGEIIIPEGTPYDEHYKYYE